MEHAGRHIPNSLRKYRKMRGYSQLEVAKLLGLASSSLISHWEHGNAIPNLENLFKLALIYSTLIDELYADIREDVRKQVRQKDIALVR